MRIQCSIEIAAPPAVVWRFVDDPEKQKLWMKGLVSNEVTNGKTGTGATFKMKIKEGRAVSEYRGEVLEHDAPRRLRIKLSGGCMKNMPPMQVDYEFTDLGGRTRMDYTAGADGGGLGMRILFAIFGWIGKQQAKSMFKTLKRVAEEEAPTAAPAGA